MADSLSGLGTTELWKVTPNWQGSIKHTNEFSRKVLEFPGTKHEPIYLSDYRPKNFNLSLSSFTKEEEFALLEKWKSHMGRYGRFWIASPWYEFDLKINHVSGASAILCHFLPFVFSGFERIYFILESGDWITRKIENITKDEDNDELVLYIDLALDRNIDMTAVRSFGTLVLARFNSDVLKLDYKTDGVSQAEMEFTELVNEYGEA